MKNINTFTKRRNESVDVTITRTITHQKHLMQPGRCTWSAVNIFNTLCIFTEEPITKQKIKLECMNSVYYITELK